MQYLSASLLAVNSADKFPLAVDSMSEYFISYCVLVAVAVAVAVDVVGLGGLLCFNRDVVADVCLSYYL
jgi:hypothetical protein